MNTIQLISGETPVKTEGSTYGRSLIYGFIDELPTYYHGGCDNVRSYLSCGTSGILGIVVTLVAPEIRSLV